MNIYWEPVLCRLCDGKEQTGGQLRVYGVSVCWGAEHPGGCGEDLAFTLKKLDSSELPTQGTPWLLQRHSTPPQSEFRTSYLAGLQELSISN